MTAADGFVASVAPAMASYALLWIGSVVVPSLGAVVLVLGLHRAADAA